MSNRLSSSPAVRLAGLGLLSLFVMALAGAVSPSASAQSLWDQLKAQAQKGKQPAAQPNAAAKPGAAKPGTTAKSTVDNGTAPFTLPPGTIVTPVVVGPFNPSGQFGISPLGVHVATLATSGSRWVQL
jgi:hypothetical protein